MPIPYVIYDALNHCFNIQRVIHCNPINLPLRANTYTPHKPKDASFGAIPYIKTAWPGTSLALPDYTPHKLKQTLEQALYSAHVHGNTSPRSHILFLPNWKYSQYLALNLHTIYVQKLTFILFHPTFSPTPNTCSPKLNIYLVSNEKALTLLDRAHILTTLQKTITKLLGKPSLGISLNLYKKINNI